MSRFTVLLLIYLKVLITSGTKSSSTACLDREHLGEKTLICGAAGAGWEDAGSPAVTPRMAEPVLLAGVGGDAGLLISRL